MSYLVAQIVLGGALVLGLGSVGRRARKDRTDMAEAESFIAALRDAS